MPNYIHLAAKNSRKNQHSNNYCVGSVITKNGKPIINGSNHSTRSCYRKFGSNFRCYCSSFHAEQDALFKLLRSLLIGTENKWGIQTD
jgi:deoxycytidylate deaminase